MPKDSADYSFLPHLLSQPVYLVAEDRVATPDAAAPEKEPTPAAEPVPVPKSKATPPPPAQTAWQFSGSAEATTAIFLHHPAPFIGSPAQVFLSNVLGAVGLKLETVLLVNLSENPGLQPGGIREYAGLQTVLLFGAAAAACFLQQAQDHYSPYQKGGYRWLTAPDLPSIATEKARKRLLWQALQQLYPQAR